MSFWHLLKISISSIVKNKVRTFLTALGIVIGISSVIVMVAIGEGSQKQISDQISGLGVNLLTVIPFAARQGGISLGAGSSPSLTLADVEKLNKENQLLSGISPVVRQSLQVVGGTGNWNTTVYGVSPEYIDIRQWKISGGENFSGSDVLSVNNVCLLGNTVSSNLFGDESPIGQEIRIGSLPVRVIGVLESKGSSGMQDQDDLVLLPYTTMQYKLSQSRFISEIVCSSISREQMTDAQNEVRTILRESHRLQSDAGDDFTVLNQSDLISTVSKTTGILTVFLASIAGISLFVGGIGIMNIMLVSVTERTREIGIRMAIGAEETDILKQFLLEALVLCLSGGAAGIVLGVALALTVKLVAGYMVVFSIKTILLAFGFSFAVGLFFGFYPAKRAAGLKPIDALRYE